MKVAVLGTGSVGRALAQGLTDAGHEVVIGTRDPRATLAATAPDRFGNPPFGQWAQGRPVRLEPFAVAAAAAGLVINATSGEVSLAVLQSVGAENLAGKVLLDVSNPLDFSRGFPPSLFVMGTDSLGEQIQRAFPDAKVVKSLNTMNAGLMLNPGRLGAPSAVFLSGDDPGAKQQVSELLASFGWEQIIDLGGIVTARGAEMMLPMWLQVLNVQGGPEFNWAIVT
jgi:predicted dinucleotide-binding enzyme